MPAHRAALLEAGVDLKPEDVVRHRCDNRICVNLDHLLIGTDSDNMIDKSHRSPRNASLKLWPHQVQEIRGLLGRVSQKAIAARYGVSQSTVSHIKRGVYWTHVS